MKWPLQKPAVPRSEIPLNRLYYLHAPRADQSDPTIVWGTDVEAQELMDFLAERNRHSPVLISISHVLMQAAGRALARHPDLNRRAVGHRLFDFREINVHMVFHHPRNGDVSVILLQNANECSLEQIARHVWKTLLSSSQGRDPIDRDRRRIKALPAWIFHSLLAIYRWFDRRWVLPSLTRLDKLRCSAVVVNDLSFRGSPPMRSYKPSRFPDESTTLSITLGPMEEKVVVRDGRAVASNIVPLFVRADHRIADAYQLGRFLGTLRDLLQHPAQLDALTCGLSAGTEQEGRNPADAPGSASSRRAA